MRPVNQEAGRRLLLSIHDVSPRFETQIDHLRDLVVQRMPVSRAALLVIPNHWGSAPILPGSSFARRLRRWAEQGAEIFLHGWNHRDEQPHATALARWKARRMTAGEGEFLGLTRAVALARLRDGRALLEDVTGRRVTGFVAPAWLYGTGAHEALAEAGFELAEDHVRVWDPRSGTTLGRGPVLTWASRSAARTAASLAAAAALPVMLRHLAVARIGLHPGDVAKPVLMRSIGGAIDRLLRSHTPAPYAALQHVGTTSCGS